MYLIELKIYFEQTNEIKIVFLSLCFVNILSEIAACLQFYSRSMAQHWEGTAGGESYFHARIREVIRSTFGSELFRAPF